jgi:hypothetical protein
MCKTSATSTSFIGVRRRILLLTHIFSRRLLPPANGDEIITVGVMVGKLSNGPEIN